MGFLLVAGDRFATQEETLYTLTQPSVAVKLQVLDAKCCCSLLAARRL